MNKNNKNKKEPTLFDAFCELLETINELYNADSNTIVDSAVDENTDCSNKKSGVDNNISEKTYEKSVTNLPEKNSAVFSKTYTSNTNEDGVESATLKLSASTKDEDEESAIIIETLSGYANRGVDNPMTEVEFDFYRENGSNLFVVFTWNAEKLRYEVDFENKKLYVDFEHGIIPVEESEMTEQKEVVNTPEEKTDNVQIEEFDNTLRYESETGVTIKKTSTDFDPKKNTVAKSIREKLSLNAKQKAATANKLQIVLDVTSVITKLLDAEDYMPKTIESDYITFTYNDLRKHDTENVLPEPHFVDMEFLCDFMMRKFGFSYVHYHEKFNDAEHLFVCGLC